MFVLAFALLTTPAHAIEWEDKQQFSRATGGDTLRVLSTTDTAVFAPIIERFLVDNPTVSIDFWVAGSTDIYQSVQQATQSADVVISSAMDLQLKLVNDG